MLFQLPDGEPGGGGEEPGQLRHLLGAHEGGPETALRTSLPQVSTYTHMYTVSDMYFQHDLMTDF